MLSGSRCVSLPLRCRHAVPPKAPSTRPSNIDHQPGRSSHHNHTLSRLQRPQTRPSHPYKLFPCPPRQHLQPFNSSPPRPSPSPTPLSIETYHALSDTYVSHLLTYLEDLAENNPSIDVEYSSGVLTLTYPPHGTYVLNKQPPNKQIWLSSPVSGPKRYDWVADQGGQEHGKGKKGRWVYLRDGSALDELLERELGVVMTGAGED